MNEYFTLCAEFSTEGDADSIRALINCIWINDKITAYPAYAEPSTYYSICTKEDEVDMLYHGVDTYLITISTEDDKYVKIYKNTY